MRPNAWPSSSPERPRRPLRVAPSGAPTYLTKPATTLIVIATITMPNTYDSSE